MSNINHNVDNDFDSFFNLDTTDFTPVSVSPAPKSAPSLAHQSSASSSNFASSQQSFVGPSYQYDSHRQQTGLPTGGLQNTFAINQASGLHYRPNQMGFIVPTETLNIPLASNLDEFDFTRNQSIDMNDMDFDADSPSDGSNMFYGQGEPAQPAPIQRIYPGMHTQQAAQAAQAKAAQALKQQEALQQRQQKQLAGQQALPTGAPKAIANDSKHVQETISNVLNRMRQASSASADDGTPPPSDGLSTLARLKKEEDMDEDERLLASEEGKKLSSKERRQLRNKVSARAFRSRRKEYISQLEAEVQQKVQEANDLLVQNRQLMEENNRLTDLTRMLLSSSSFSGFLQELSNSGTATTVPQTSQTPAAQPAQMRKDISLHEATRQLQNQNQPTIGMAMIPETNINMGAVESNWNSLPSNDFQIFSVTALPQPPALDLSFMERLESKSFNAPAKDVPQLSSLPPPMELAEDTVDTVSSVETVIVEDEYDLYSTVSTITSTPVESAQELIASLRKPDTDVDVQVEVPVSAVSLLHIEGKLEEMCQALEDSCTRLAKYIPSKEA